MTNRNLLIAVVLAGVAVSGTVLGQSMDGSSSETVDSDTGEWEMFSGNVVALEATGGGSTGTVAVPQGSERFVDGPLFIFNTRTGKVYRVFTDCNELGIHGCIEALPVIEEGQVTTMIPRPLSGGGQIRR